MTRLRLRMLQTIGLALLLAAATSAARLPCVEPSGRDLIMARPLGHLPGSGEGIWFGPQI
jgi:hypothetical protein